MTYTFSDDLFSDLHKDAFGFRPHYYHVQWASLSDDAKQAEWNRMVEIAAERECYEREQQTRAATSWTDMFLNAADGGIPRELVIEALAKFYDVGYDRDFLCWNVDVPYGFFD